MLGVAAAVVGITPRDDPESLAATSATAQAIDSGAPPHVVLLHARHEGFTALALELSRMITAIGYGRVVLDYMTGPELTRLW